MSFNENPDFDDLLLQRATESDLNDIVNFLMRDFLHNEPLNKSIHLTESDADNLFIGERIYLFTFISSMKYMY